jgi:hypothetical protein
MPILSDHSLHRIYLWTPGGCWDPSESAMMAYGYRGIAHTHALRTINPENQGDLVRAHCLGCCTSLSVEQFYRTPTLEPGSLDPFSGFPLVSAYAHGRHREYPLVLGVRILTSLSTIFGFTFSLDRCDDYRHRRQCLAFGRTLPSLLPQPPSFDDGRGMQYTRSRPWWIHCEKATRDNINNTLAYKMADAGVSSTALRQNLRSLQTRSPARIESPC